MAKTRTFQVIGNRIQFKCPVCKSRKYLTVQQHSRRRNMRCSGCGEITRCLLDRRSKPREICNGKIVMITEGGRHLEVYLHDISVNGIGINIPVKILRSRKLKKGRKVRFKCNWNPKLLNSGNFMIHSVKDQRVGIKKIGIGNR